MAVLQGTLDLMVLRTLQAMGPMHAYAIARRLQQVSGDAMRLNQGTLYPALVRMEQRGYIQGEWRRSEANHEARFYSLTRGGRRQLAAETGRWHQLAGVMARLLGEEA